MATVRPSRSSSTAVTITLTSLADSAARQSTSIDDTTSPGPCLDYQVQAQIKLVTGAPANQKLVYVFLWGSEDGTKVTDAITGTDGMYTMYAPSNVRLDEAIQTPKTCVR